ncbi:MAG: UDP-4-amino-4,6-dideoxy-N-acetyl-beta-L-altrosamine transaminase [Nevskiaceae bacterium]
MTRIGYGRQDLVEADVAAVVAALRSGWLTQGPAVERFEQAVAQYCGASHAVAVSSGSAALHLACRALDLGPGDALWTSPNTFAASANGARHCGAAVDFVDVEPDSGNLSVERLAEKLARTEAAGRLPRAVVPVHFAGRPCDLGGVHALAARYGFRVIEDACHALGATCDGHRVGGGAQLDVAVLSFHPVKSITTGEGGMVLTHDAALADRVRRLRSHGMTRDAALMPEPPDGPWRSAQVELGYNYRLTDLQCALGAQQLTRLDELVARRRERVAGYAQRLAGLPLRLPEEPDGASSAWHLYVVRFEDAARRRPAFEALAADGIDCQVHYYPLHLQPYYRQAGFAPGDFPEAERHYREALSLPLFPALTEADQARVAEVLRRVLA